MISGTSIPQTASNEAVVSALEKYRDAMEQGDSAMLLRLASKRYWDDAGTPIGSDDIGYQGLRQSLASRFRQASAIRYSMRYLRLRRAGNRAYVEAMIDASFSTHDPRGKEVRHDMRDQNQFVLEWDGEEWKFLSGM